MYRICTSKLDGGNNPTWWFNTNQYPLTPNCNADGQTIYTKNGTPPFSTPAPPPPPPPAKDNYTVHEHCTFGQNTTAFIPEEDKDKVGPATLLKRTLNEAKDVCNKYSECIGFVRDNSVKDPNTPSNTQFDKIINNPTNYNYDDSLQCNSMWSWAVYTKDGTTPVLNQGPQPPSPLVVQTSAPTCKYADRSSYADDYQNTCTLESNSNGNISAACRKKDGRTVAASINSCDCAGRIQNYDGKLVCSNRSDYQGDDYRNSCTNIDITAGLITATCDAYGNPNQTSISESCAGRIQNVGGNLVCR